MEQESSEIGALARELRRHVALLRSTGVYGLGTDTPEAPTPIAKSPAAPAVSDSPSAEPRITERAPEPKPIFPQQAAAELQTTSTREEKPEITTVPAPLPVTKPPASAEPNNSAIPASAQPQPGAFESLEALRTHIGDCTRCPLHAQGRQHIVFGVGNPQADIMFIGEAPGAHEDRQGVPFVGKAGELLTRIIEGGMKRSRDDVYIANVIKCRPPQNRDPSPEEVATCRPFILQQIDLVNPKVIVTLGRVAAQALLQTKRSITHMRGEWQELKGVPVMPTFHPAYLLRNPAGKRQVWSDIQEVIRRLESGERS